MYVSCSALCCTQARYPAIEDALAKIKGLGFGAFDLDVFENWQHINPSELAEDPECPNITLQPGQVLDGIEPDVQFATMREHLAALADLRGDRTLTIGLEGHAHTLIEKPDAAIAMIESLWPAVGYTYDPSHPELQGIPLPQTEPLLDWTCHVHIRNASLDHMQDTMADGTLDVAWVVDALRRHGYGGAVTIEYFNDFDPDFASVCGLRDRLVELGVAAAPPSG